PPFCASSYAGCNEGSNDSNYQPLESHRGAPNRPAKRQRLPPSHQSATKPVTRQTRAGRVAVASTSTAQPDFSLPEETSTEWLEVPQLTVGTTSPQTPPQAPVRLPRSRQKFATSVVESDDLSELGERDASSGGEYQDACEGDDESQRSADEPKGSTDEPKRSTDDAEVIDDEFQGPAGKSELEDVPEDDANDVPLKTDEEKSAEILRKVAAPYLKQIRAMVSLDRDCEMIYYTIDYDRNGGAKKNSINGYERRIITLWNSVVQLEKAHGHVLLNRATLIPEMLQVKEIECVPPPDYALLTDSALRGNSTYNERCWAAIFAMISDWDPHSFDNYLTLRRGAPALVAENPHLAIPRLIHIGPTYEDLNSNGAIAPLNMNGGPTRAKNLLAHPHLPSELEPEARKMHEQVIRAQADTHDSPVKLAAARLLELRGSNTLWPESGDLGVLHIPVPSHDEDFELGLDAVVPADVVFDRHEESVNMTLTHTDADNCRTILERCGEEFTISKYDADGDLVDQIVSNLKLAQQLVEPEREKTVARRLKGIGIIQDFGGSRRVFSEAYPPPLERVVRPLRPGNVWKNGEDIPLKKMKNKLASTRPRQRKAAPPVDSAPLPSDVPTKPVFGFECERCGDKFVDKVAYGGHLKLKVKCLQPAPHPASRPPTSLDEAADEQTESTSSLECTACEKTFDSPEAKDSHLRTNEGWECVLGRTNPRKMNRTKNLYACCMCRGDYDCDGIPGLEQYWKMFHSDESKSRCECETA
ncbi:unnamed protein product, partial [Rhizoctonia solani]